MTIEARFSQEAQLFGKRIRQLRKGANLNQVDLGEVVGLTQSQISLVEKGSLNFEFFTLIKLANGLSVPVASLFDYVNAINFRRLNKKQELTLRLKTEKEKFGKRILDLIESRSTKQDDLAVISNIDAGDLSRFINGEHNIELYNIVKIAEGLKVELVELFFYKGPLPNNKEFKGLVKPKTK